MSSFVKRNLIILFIAGLGYFLIFVFPVAFYIAVIIYGILLQRKEIVEHQINWINTPWYMQKHPIPINPQTIHNGQFIGKGLIFISLIMIATHFFIEFT